MPRLFIIHLILFLLPFAAYAFFLVLKRENPFTGAAWRLRELVWLSIAGFMLSVVIFGTLAQHAGENISGRSQSLDVKP